MTEPASIDENEKQISKAIFLIAVIILVLNNLPYIWGISLTPDDKVFSGIIHTHADLFSYIAKMRQGFDGQWHYVNRYTTEPHRPSLLFFFYLFLGHVARWIHAPLIITYHLARVAAGIFLLYSVNRALKVIHLRGFTRLLAFTFAFTAEGIGWIPWLLVPHYEPMEFWINEAYTFQSMLSYPHFVITTALIVWMLCDLAEFTQSASWTRCVSLALSGFVMGWVHPRLLLTVAVAGGLTALIELLRRRGTLLRWIIGLSCGIAGGVPPSLMIVLSYRGDPIWETWAGTVTSSPEFSFFLSGFGLLVPLAAWGTALAWKRGDRALILIIAWLACGVVLPYLPLISQRRLMQGINIPIALLAAYALGEGLFPLLRFKRGWGETGILALSAGVTFFMSLSVLMYLLLSVAPLVEKLFPYYISLERAHAHEWLNKNTDRDDVVMCGYTSAMMIPGMAGNRVVLGHWAETINRVDKELEVNAFFDARTHPDVRDDIILRHKIKFVLYGGIEHSLEEHNPDWRPYEPQAHPERWREVWREKDLRILELVALKPAS